MHHPAVVLWNGPASADVARATPAFAACLQIRSDRRDLAVVRRRTCWAGGAPPGIRTQNLRIKRRLRGVQRKRCSALTCGSVGSPVHRVLPDTPLPRGYAPGYAPGAEGASADQRDTPADTPAGAARTSIRASALVRTRLPGRAPELRTCERVARDVAPRRCPRQSDVAGVVGSHSDGKGRRAAEVPGVP